MEAREARLLREIDPAVLGRRIRDLRVALGLTQGQLAGDEVTVGYISRIEAGKRRPEAKLLELLAGRLHAGLADLLDAEQPDDRLDDDLRLPLDFAELSLESGDALQAEESTAEVLKRLKKDGAVVQRAHYLHARALEARGLLEDAITEFEELVADTSGRYRLPASIALSRCYREAGELARAIQIGEEVLMRLSADDLDASDEAVQLTLTVAAAYFERGDVNYALRLCRQSIERAEASGSPVARASAYWNASAIEANRGSVAKAIPLAERALALLSEGRDTRNLARMRLQLGTMMLQGEAPDVADAKSQLTIARDALVASSASAVDIARCDVGLARISMLLGRTAEARSWAAAVHESLVGQAQLVAAEARVLEGQAAAAEGDMAAAHDAYRSAVWILTAIGADRATGELWFDLGALFDEAGDSDSARDAYRSAAASVGMRSRSLLGVRFQS